MLKNVFTKLSKRSIMHLSLLIGVLSVLFFAFITATLIKRDSAQAQAQEEKTYTVRYTSVRIYYGDTLWELADEYKGFQTTKEWVKEVERLNRIYDGNIKSGSYIVVPYYVPKNLSSGQD